MIIFKGSKLGITDTFVEFAPPPITPLTLLGRVTPIYLFSIHMKFNLSACPVL